VGHDRQLHDTVDEGSNGGGDYTGVPAELSGLATAQWRQTQFANSAGQHMVAVSGFDNPIVYNATAGLTRLTSGNGIDPYTINAVNPALFIAVCTHQRRLWFVEKNTMKGWYLPTDAVYGVAVKFDFGPIFDMGGYLVGMFTWSKNTYSGPQNQLVVVTSEGQMAVYQGTRPGQREHMGADWRQLHWRANRLQLRLQHVGRPNTAYRARLAQHEPCHVGCTSWPRHNQATQRQDSARAGRYCGGQQRRIRLADCRVPPA
jgi:hypothetical protein